ncbi:MAG TPA: hypothetical protein VHA13_03695 [Gammaproteobacteria bacterium]|nr:hypothetical protein [Gammaproteobacteria bacterium]
MSSQASIKLPENLSRKLDISFSAGNSASFGLTAAFRQFFFPAFYSFTWGFLIPFNAVANVIRALLSIYDANKKNYDRVYVVRAIIATLAGAAIATSIVGGIVATAAFMVIGPILNMIGISLRCLHHAGMGIFQLYKASIEKDPFQKQWLKNDAVIHGIHFLSTACNALAVGLVLLLFKASFGILGVVGGALGVLASILNFYELTRCEQYNAVKKGFSTSEMGKTLGGLKQVGPDLSDNCSKESPHLNGTMGTSQAANVDKALKVKLEELQPPVGHSVCSLG